MRPHTCLWSLQWPHSVWEEVRCGESLKGKEQLLLKYLPFENFTKTYNHVSTLPNIFPGHWEWSLCTRGAKNFKLWWFYSKSTWRWNGSCNAIALRVCSLTITLDSLVEIYASTSAELQAEHKTSLCLEVLGSGGCGVGTSCGAVRGPGALCLCRGWSWCWRWEDKLYEALFLLSASSGMSAARTHCWNYENIIKLHRSDRYVCWRRKLGEWAQPQMQPQKQRADVRWAWKAGRMHAKAEEGKCTNYKWMIVP